MKLQIIESISKHAVTLVLVIGILMLTEKGIMPTGIIAMLLLTGGIIGFSFQSSSTDCQDSIYSFSLSDSCFSNQ